jgi:hypothetical protein
VTVQEFREIICEVAEEAKTGSIEAIRAIKILPRMILHESEGGKK